MNTFVPRSVLIWEKNGGQKCLTGQRFISTKVTFYKIHILICTSLHDFESVNDLENRELIVVKMHFWSSGQICTWVLMPNLKVKSWTYCNLPSLLHFLLLLQSTHVWQNCWTHTYYLAITIVSVSTVQPSLNQEFLCT